MMLPLLCKIENYKHNIKHKAKNAKVDHNDQGTDGNGDGTMTMTNDDDDGQCDTIAKNIRLYNHENKDK